MLGMISGLASSLLGGAGAAAGGALASKALGGSADADPQAGITSSVQGANTPPPGEPASTKAFGAQAKELITDVAADVMTGGKNAIVSGLESKISERLTGGAGKQGRNAREYLDNAFPELNPWEKAGAGASGIGAQTGEDNAMKMKRMELKNAKEIAGIQSATAIKTAQISSAPSHERNLLDSPKIEAEISNIYAQGSLTREQAAHEVFKTFETQMRTAGIQVNTQLLRAQINKALVDTNLSHAQIQKTLVDAMNGANATSEVTKPIYDFVRWLGHSFDVQATKDTFMQHVPNSGGIPSPVKPANHKGKR